MVHVSITYSMVDPSPHGDYIGYCPPLIFVTQVDAPPANTMWVVSNPPAKDSGVKSSFAQINIPYPSEPLKENEVRDTINTRLLDTVRFLLFRWSSTMNYIVPQESHSRAPVLVPLVVSHEVHRAIRITLARTCPCRFYSMSISPRWMRRTAFGSQLTSRRLPKPKVGLRYF